MNHGIYPGACWFKDSLMRQKIIPSHPANFGIFAPTFYVLPEFGLLFGTNSCPEEYLSLYVFVNHECFS